MNLIFCALISLCPFAVSSAGPGMADHPLSPEKPGLLIVAHGSPSLSWTAPIEALIGEVKKRNTVDRRFISIRLSFLEFSKPSVAEGIAALEADGCSRIVVVPLFVAPSAHSHMELPVVLGLTVSPETARSLRKEGIELARPGVPVVLTHTMSEGPLFEEYVRDAAKKLSFDPGRDTIVLLAHGTDDMPLFIERAFQHLGATLAETSGVRDVSWAYCDHGPLFAENGVPAIREAAIGYQRVLVIGMYLSLPASTFDRRADGEDPFPGLDVLFSPESLVRHPALPRWVLDTASEAVIR